MEQLETFTPGRNPLLQPTLERELIGMEVLKRLRSRESSSRRNDAVTPVQQFRIKMTVSHGKFAVTVGWLLLLPNMLAAQEI